MAAEHVEIFTPVTIFFSLPSMLLVAWIAARLLGVRHRSWIAAVTAGVGGWVLTGLFSLAVTHGRAEELHTGVVLAFSILATMAVTVSLDLLSGRAPRRRPLLSVPHPVRRASAAVRRLRRYVRVLRIALRHGFGPYLGLHGAPEEAAASAASARAAMEEAGGVFVKLGQLLAGRADILPAEARHEFAHLHEDVQAADPEAVNALLEAEFGATVADVFEFFDHQPVAAASIAQAHAARLRTGVDVIVKVQRPGIGAVIEDDLAITWRLARMIERRTEWGHAYRVSAVADEFASALREELDFRSEARNLREGALALSGHPEVVVPKIYEDLSTRRVLVLERLTGVPLTAPIDPARLPGDGRKLADTLLHAVVGPIMAGERFHADPHPGNIRLLSDGRLGLLDFGATGRLDAFEQSSIVDMLLAIRGRDPALLLDAVRQVTVVPAQVDERQLEHALGRFLARNVSPVGTPDATMFAELLQVFLSFRIALPAGTTTMFRALVTLQGTLELLCPDYPVIDAAEEMASGLLLERAAPRTLVEAAQQELITAAPVLRRIPHHLDRISGQLQRGELRLQTRLTADPTDARLFSRLVGQIVLVLAAAAAGGISIGLLAVGGGPAITSGLSMYEAFAYAGLGLSLILLLRVITAVIRESR